MKAIVIGGGIAGPATAMALQQVGVDVTILERRSDDGRATGSYFSIAPNGLSALDAIGALDLARPLGAPAHDSLMYGATGRLLGRVTLGTPLADGTPSLAMRRGDLTGALMDEAARRGILVRYAARVTSVRTSPERAVVTLEDGTELDADLVVAADGIHSVARRTLDAGAPAPRYVGLTNFGGITRNSPIADRLAPEAWTFVFGRRAFFGAFPEPNGDVVWFVNVPRPEISREERASTTDAQWKEWLTSLLAGDRSEAAALVAAGELQLAGDNTYDLGHVPVWHDDRLVLVWDAAHAPSPSSGQGASMALEDAVALATALRDAPSVPEALSSYEAARRARVEKIVAVGARSSSSKIPGRVGRIVQEAVMRLVFRFVTTDDRQQWMTGHRTEPLTAQAASGRSADARQ